MGGEGTRFGSYTLLRRIATGGMAEIYLARQEGVAGFAREVVIKRIHRHLSVDHEFVSMFLDEGRLVARLSHPNIASVHDFGIEQGAHYLVMEHVHGVPLSSAIKRSGGVEPAHALRIASEMCAGLHYAHSLKDGSGTKLGIVHRDVSPQNVLISFDGAVKLIDFGVARATTQAHETKAGAMKGKYAYMSPEQAGGKDFDHRADIHSVGIVLWEMLTGRGLYQRENIFDSMQAVIKQTPPKATSRKPELPAEVDEVLAKALAKKPEDRYETCSEMQLALDDFASSIGLHSSSLRLGRYIRSLFMVQSSTGEVRHEDIKHTTDVSEDAPRLEDVPDSEELQRALAGHEPFEEETDEFAFDLVEEPAEEINTAVPEVDVDMVDDDAETGVPERDEPEDSDVTVDQDAYATESIEVVFEAEPGGGETEPPLSPPRLILDDDDDDDEDDPTASLQSVDVQVLGESVTPPAPEIARAKTSPKNPMPTRKPVRPVVIVVGIVAALLAVATVLWAAGLFEKGPPAGQSTGHGGSVVVHNPADPADPIVDPPVPQKGDGGLVLLTGPDEPVDIDAALEDLQAAYLTIISAPKKAMVWVDGRETRERTNVRDLPLDPGEHLIELTLPGFKRWRKRVNVRGGKTLRVGAKLEPVAGGDQPEDPEPLPEDVEYGILSIDSSPPAQVKARGRELGRTPIKNEEFPEGAHVVVLVLDDGRRFQKTVTVRGGRSTRASFDFDTQEPTPEEREAQDPGQDDEGSEEAPED